MYSEKFSETIHACRFCFMCRHLSPVGNVTYRESDTPRGRALMLDKVSQQPQLLENPDFQSAIYDAELSAACRTHCVSHFDEAGLLLAARRDIVESGKIPAVVKQVADSIKALKLALKGDAKAEVIYYVDRYTERYQPEMAAATEKILKAAGVSFQIISGADTGKALAVLGCWNEAKETAEKFAKSIRGVGKKVLITSCPASYDLLKNDFPKYGIDLANELEVLHTSEFIRRLVKAGKLSLRPSTAQSVFPLASDFLGNYNTGFTAHEELAALAGVTLQPFGFNREESYTAGEGGVVMDELNPRLVAKLVEHVLEQVDNPSQDMLLVLSPYTKYVLSKFATKKLHLTTVEELIAARIKE
ncbi:MAG: hypothetical protein B9S32_04425 [Verrucomicrobia bacterium Tous-C9LFEB]|nr:MAG: hypothetical protein B9S32_04425 [Verrucomicrobia bacterium Tous-C9LFEB]